jgi:hypothetical protein
LARVARGRCDAAMRMPFVEDGSQRLRRSPEYRARLRQLRASVYARHTVELAQAGFFRRLVLYGRVAIEYFRERRKVVPSSKSLY